MPRPSDKERLEKLKLRAEALEKKVNEKERKDDTRMKILAGAFLIDAIEKNPKTRA